MSYKFAAESFHAKKLCSRLFSAEVQFSWKNADFAFLTHSLGVLGATYHGRRQAGSRGCSAPPVSFSSTGTDAGP